MLDIRQIGNAVFSGQNVQKSLSIIFSLLAILIATNLNAQEVKSEIDLSEIKIGEEILYTIEVETDSITPVGFPKGQTFGPLEMIESYDVDTTFNAAKVRLIKKYGLTQFDSGRYTIPPQRIEINNKLFTTDSIRVEVNDIVVDTLQQGMFDIKPAVAVKNPPINWLNIAYWVLVLLVIAAIVFFILRRKKQKEKAEKQLPPYEEAIFALQQLDNSQLLKEDTSKEYYSSLTEIVKRYLDREVDEFALESTSGELIQRLLLHKQAGNFDFDMETIHKLDAIFKRADLVKFARMKHHLGQVEVDRKTIEDIINETKEVIPEPTEEELLENQEYLEKIRRKQIRKKWMLGAAGVFLALILAGGIYGAISGFDNLKDKVIGNHLRELSEKKWIKSEYGYPSVTIETPDVLKRTDIPAAEISDAGVRAKDVFTFGDMKSPIYIMVSTFRFGEGQQIELDSAMDAILNEMEADGAKNLLVMRDDFETGKGINGIRATGEFNLQVSEKKVLKKTSSYELLLFAQQNGLQEVLIVFQDDEKYAPQIVKRIIESIELEITLK